MSVATSSRNVRLARMSFQQRLYALLPQLGQADSNSIRYYCARPDTAVLVTFRIDGSIEVLVMVDYVFTPHVFEGPVADVRAIAQVIMEITEVPTYDED